MNEWSDNKIECMHGIHMRIDSWWSKKKSITYNRGCQKASSRRGRCVCAVVQVQLVPVSEGEVQGRTCLDRPEAACQQVASWDQGPYVGPDDVASRPCEEGPDGEGGVMGRRVPCADERRAVSRSSLHAVAWGADSAMPR